MVNWKSTCLILVGVYSISVGTLPGEPEFSSTVLYDSKYVSEGRDNLEDGGLPSVEIAAAFESVTLGTWYARGDSTDYDELNLFIDYGFSLGEIEGYLSYTRLEFFEDGESDDEISLGFAGEVLGGITLAADYVYSMEAEGAFIELSVGREFEIEETNWTIGVYALEGFDFGYASEAYDGLNNFQVGLYMDYSLSDSASLIGGLSQSWAHGDVKRDGLGNLTWASIGLQAEF